MKVGIISLYGDENYGNKLQNYALQVALRKIGVEPVTLVQTAYGELSRLKKALWILKRRPLYTLGRGLKMVINRADRLLKDSRSVADDEEHAAAVERLSLLRARRRKAFRAFVERQIAEDTFGIRKDFLPKDLAERCDAFIIGSDQVWVPGIGIREPFLFLTFAKPAQRIAYAASFSIPKIPRGHQRDFRTGLLGIKHISVREERGAEIVYELTGRRVPVVLDPTMLLNKSDWEQVIEEDPNIPKTPYLLTFFLGQRTEEYENNLRDIAQRYNLDPVHLNDPADEERYTIGPGQFLTYIRNAAFVATDSFHCTVFSILFSRPFLAFNRVGHTRSMISRLETLLRLVGMEHRFAHSDWKMETIFKLEECKVAGILDKERQSSLRFLFEALGMEEKEH